MSIALHLHLHLPQHCCPARESSGHGDMPARHAQAEAVRARVAAILPQLMQALATGRSPQDAEGVGGAGAGKAQGLLQELAQLLQLLSQLDSGGNGQHRCKPDALLVADGLEGGSGANGAKPGSDKAARPDTTPPIDGSKPSHQVDGPPPDGA